MSSEKIPELLLLLLFQREWEWIPSKFCLNLKCTGIRFTIINCTNVYSHLNMFFFFYWTSPVVHGLLKKHPHLNYVWWIDTFHTSPVSSLKSCFFLHSDVCNNSVFIKHVYKFRRPSPLGKKSALSQFLSFFLFSLSVIQKGLHSLHF